MKKVYRITLLLLAVFALFLTTASAFSDINDKNADFLVSKGIIKGYEDGTFKPNNNITRAEFSTIMCRALGITDYAQSVSNEQMFSDVPTSNWACGYINALAKKGIINGVGDGKFDPNSTITYAQVSKILASALGYTNEDANHYGGFPDGWQKLAEIGGFSVETKDINKPINRIGVVNALYATDIVYKEPTTVIRSNHIETADPNYLKTVEKLIIDASTMSLPYNWHKLGFDNLKEIECDPNNPVYSVEDGVLFIKGVYELVKYPANKPGISYKIPDGITSISNGAFYNCKNLTKIEFTEDVGLICQEAFVGCKFRELSIPRGMKKILDDAFVNCKYLEKIYIPSEELSTPVTDIFAGGNKDLVIYSDIDTYGAMAKFTAKYQYKLNGTMPGYMPDNINKIYVGISYEDAKNTLKEFGVYNVDGIDAKWVVYGSYDKFTTAYFNEGKAEFVFSNEMKNFDGRVSYFVDMIGHVDWGIGMGTLPRMVPCKASEMMIFHFINVYRHAYNLEPLTYDEDLADIARYHSENMSKAKVLSHDLNGESPSDRLVKFGYNYSGYAENIAKGPYSVTVAVCGWIDSEGHRNNILTKNLKKTGVGISKENLFFTQLFANGGINKQENKEPVKEEKPTVTVPVIDVSTIVTDKQIPDGTYEIVTKLNADYALDIYGGSKDSGANVQIWHRNNTDAQKFIVTHIGDGYYTIINKNSGKAIDAQMGSTESGTNVWQYTTNNTDAQIWRIIRTSDKKSYYIINKASGMFLDVNLAIAADGTNVKLYVQNDEYDAQKWHFVKK